MHNKFVKTQNVQNLMVALAKIEKRGAPEACFLVVEGLPGLGKSATVSYLAAQRPSLYVRMNTNATPASCMGDFAAALGGVSHSHYKINYRFVQEELQKRISDAAARGEDFIVIIDEADHIASGKITLETIRDLSDLFEVPFLLVGMDKLSLNLRRFKQISSRIGQMVKYEPLSETDVAKVLAEKCTFSVDKSIITQIAQTSKGFMREIMDAIASVENFAARQKQGTLVTAADMAGQPLFFDRSTNKVIKVKG